MPVQQLTDQAGVGTLLGMVGGYLAGNPERKAKKAQLDIENKRNAANDARLNQEAADTNANITDEIKVRDAGLNRTNAQDLATKNSQGAYQKYLPMLSNPPTTDGKPLTGPALEKALSGIRTQAINSGMTGKDDLAEFNTEIARIMQADQAQNARSFAGKEMALPGDPKQRLGVLLKREQAERAVPGLDLRPTQDAIAATQKQITEAQAAAYQNANLAERKNRDATVEGQGAQRPGIEATRAARTGGRGPDGLTPYEELESRRWMQTHNPDGSPKAPSRADLSGLSNAGKEAYNRDMMIWTMQAMSGPPPDPSDPKYPKRSAAPAGGAAPAPTGKRVVETRVINGVPWHKYSDGTFGR